jgi:hypothetical protein
MPDRPNEIRRHRSPIGEMVLRDDGVLVHTLDVGALVDRRVAAQVVHDTEVLAAGAPIAVVVDLRNVAYADRESRRLFATNTAGGVEVATALVVGAKVPEFLAAQWVGESDLNRPASVFWDIEEATSWAAARRQELAGG